PAFVLTAEPLNSPVPRGDRLRFRIAFTNNIATAFTGDLVLEVEHQTGFTVSRTLARGATLAAGQTASPTFALRVPQRAPLGLYYATVTALDGGTIPVAETTFGFRIVPTEGVSSGPEGEPWSPILLNGDGLLIQHDPAISAVAARGTSAWPNPASDRATITFALDRPAPVRLTLYDVLGREVAAVGAGHLEPGPHRLALDL